MTIAVLYIAIGPYEKFWEAFHRSCESYFLVEHPKKYILFTDSKRISSSDKISIVHVNDQGWPRNTLNRFEFFDSVSKELTKADYCFFFNANTLFLKPITSNEILPTAKQDHLVHLSWHTYQDCSAEQLPYDRNPTSTACMSPSEGSKYYQGGLYGGKTNEFLEMNATLFEHVRIDDAHGVIARNNDESHLNKYLANKHPLCLSTTYGRPEEWLAPVNPSIIFRRKEATIGFFRIFRQKKKPFIYLFRQIKTQLKEYSPWRS